MATVQPTITDVSGNGQVFKAVWALTTADHTGAAISDRFAEFVDRTVYFLGTWGGATAAVEGGDGTTYVALTDPQGNAVAKTVDGIEVITEIPQFTRPRLTAVGVGATVNATIIMRRGFKRG